MKKGIFLNERCIDILVSFSKQKHGLLLHKCIWTFIYSFHKSEAELTKEKIAFGKQVIREALVLSLGNENISARTARNFLILIEEIGKSLLEQKKNPSRKE